MKQSNSKTSAEHYYGLKWSKQSCWMDASLMAMFFPRTIYEYLIPFIMKADIHSEKHNELESIKLETLDIAENVRSPNNHLTHVDTLRTLLHRHSTNRDQKMAFQPEHKYGYVYYFLIEFLKMFKIPCVTYYCSKIKQKQQDYIIQLDSCYSVPLETCLTTTTNSWQMSECFGSIPFIIIEINNDHVIPTLQITWKNRQWKLMSMIVYGCSHFMTYINRNDEWFIYDDNNTLHKIPLQPMKFGDIYDTGFCKFKYGSNNTFFFYVHI
jgi:hypothetical protein